jgi:hypothetical protein
MILHPNELPVLKPFIRAAEVTGAYFKLETSYAGGRTTTTEVSSSGIFIKATYPDSAPCMEFYRHPQGLAQAYCVPLRTIVDEK